MATAAWIEHFKWHDIMAQTNTKLLQERKLLLSSNTYGSGRVLCVCVIRTNSLILFHTPSGQDRTPSPALFYCMRSISSGGNKSERESLLDKKLQTNKCVSSPRGMEFPHRLLNQTKLQDGGSLKHKKYGRGKKKKKNELPLKYRIYKCPLLFFILRSGDNWYCSLGPN
jgi:hypothetical protein